MLAFWKNNKKAWGSRCVSGGRMGRDGIKGARRRMGVMGTAVPYFMDHDKDPEFHSE